MQAFAQTLIHSIWFKLSRISRFQYSYNTFYYVLAVLAHIFGFVFFWRRTFAAMRLILGVNTLPLIIKSITRWIREVWFLVNWILAFLQTKRSNCWGVKPTAHGTGIRSWFSRVTRPICDPEFFIEVVTWCWTFSTFSTLTRNSLHNRS